MLEGAALEALQGAEKVLISSHSAAPTGTTLRLP